MAQSPVLKEKIQALRSLVGDLREEDPKLSNRYYLAHWLRANKYDVERAAQAIKTNREWRRENNIDALGNEEPDSAFSRKFPFFVDVRGKDGRPVVYSHVGLVDLTELVREFGKEKTLRQLALALVKVEKAVYDWENEHNDANGSDDDVDTEKASVCAVGCLWICNAKHMTVKKMMSIEELKMYLEWTKMSVYYFANVVYVAHILNAAPFIPFRLFNPILRRKGVALQTYSSQAREEEYESILRVITSTQLLHLEERAEALFPDICGK